MHIVQVTVQFLLFHIQKFEFVFNLIINFLALNYVNLAAGHVFEIVTCTQFAMKFL
jgi:hypothetical protein